MKFDNDIRSAARTMWSSVKGYLSFMDYLVPQSEAEEAIRDGVNFRGTNMLILVFAIFIASLGLNTNSTAVIIGAMLISPLMGPIIGLGLGVGINDFDLIKRSARNLCMAALFSLLASTLYFLISPVNENHSELLARTSPTIYDVLIAFFGGAAGIVALGSRSKGNVIPGVAIATALMPPLCTAGYGLATWQLPYLFGALYLFIINSIYIGFATLIGVKMMKYKRRAIVNTVKARRVRRMVEVLVVVTVIPAIFMTYRMVRDTSYQTKISNFVGREFNFKDTRVLNFNIGKDGKDRVLSVTLIGRILPQDSLLRAMNARLAEAGFEGTRLEIIQGEYPDLPSQPTTPDAVKDIFQIAQLTTARQARVIDSLENELRSQLSADTMASTLSPVIRTFFPEVREMSIVHPVFTDIATGTTDTVHVAMVSYSREMNAEQRDKLSEYLSATLKVKEVYIVETGQQIPFGEARTQTP